MIAGLIFAASLAFAEPIEPIDCTIDVLYYEEPEEPREPDWVWEGSVLTKSSGVNYGPLGRETYYNLPMGRCIDIMRSYGYSVEEYPYWVRDDGVKMMGDYVMVAANTSLYSKGTIIPTSLGMAIVVDHCPSGAIDICVTW